MEADWEVEIGGGAPVIEADWPGFIDLRKHPERVGEIAESVFSPLADLLLALNSARSPLWTSKCDVWEPAPGALACYVDLLPRDGSVFAEWQQAESFCRQYIARLDCTGQPGCRMVSPEGSSPPADHQAAADTAITLVVRQAIAAHTEGFGVTAYFSANATGGADTQTVMAALLAAFADAIPGTMFPQRPVQS